MEEGAAPGAPTELGDAGGGAAEPEDLEKMRRGLDDLYNLM